MKGWKRVPFDSKELAGGALIRIFRKKGRVVATVTQYEWFEPDGHEWLSSPWIATSYGTPHGANCCELRPRSFAEADEGDTDLRGYLDAELSLSDRCARSAGTRHVVDLPALIAERGTDLDVDYVFKQSLTCPECGEPGGGLQIKERGAGSW
ncbi:hypothetical protein [Mesorhizobium caraganae]|uniref:hypothetical protein n=1 Tax=Mesorhizobium caraganae TaxID=483206 RepID=UPI003ECE6B01